MIINNTTLKEGSLFICLLLTINSCNPDFVDDPIPYQPFDDVVLNLSLPENAELNTIGSIDLSIRYPNAGVKGIILHKKNSTTYLAFEKNCSFQPNDVGATVSLQGLSIQDSSCGSQFNFDGVPTSGPAWRPLQQYQTSFSAGSNTLTITDIIVE